MGICLLLLIWVTTLKLIFGKMGITSCRYTLSTVFSDDLPSNFAMSEEPQNLKPKYWIDAYLSNISINLIVFFSGKEVCILILNIGSVCSDDIRC